jgi:hypothetical protein
MQYVKECLQLLYWIYFKHYTLEQHVREICPEITVLYEDNSAEAKANPRLQQFYDQASIMTTLPQFFFFAVLSLMTFERGIAELSVLIELLKNNLPLFGVSVILLTIYTVTSGRYALIITAITALGYLFATNELLNILTYHPLRQEIFGGIFSMAVGISIRTQMQVITNFTKSESNSLVNNILLSIFRNLDRSMIVGVATGGIICGEVGSAVGWKIGVAFIFVSVGYERTGTDLAILVALSIAFSMAINDAVAFGWAFGISFVFSVLRIYFWLPELLWTLCLKFVPSSRASRLRFLPPQFDQLIYLPLPFLPGFIAAAYQENQAAARQTISYLISSTNQQKTAGKAMLLIAAESFSRCGSAKEIAAVRAQLDWLPAELAGKITDCLELSQDTAAALEASTPYRKEKRIGQVLKKLEQLRRGLAFASAREATALGSVLDHWLRLLETEQRVLREAARRSEEIPQVYLPGPPLEPDKAGSLFKGRRDLFRQIESLILSAQPPTLVLHGGRRSGAGGSAHPLGPASAPPDPAAAGQR